MYFQKMIKHLCIDVLMFCALAFGVLLLYLKIVPFATSAFILKKLNFQTISYIVYTILLTLLPGAFLSNPIRFSKPQLLGVLFNALGIVVLTGTLADLIVYRFFIGYTFLEGDVVFVNVMWNMPGLWGAALSVTVAALYFEIAEKIKSVRRASYILFLIITLFSTLVPFLYTYILTGALPRQNYLDKALFLIPIHVFMLMSLSLSAASRKFWRNHIWNKQ